MNGRAVMTDDQRDALQEVANIGMGQAGASIASLLNEFVELSIPRVAVVGPNEIADVLTRFVGDRPVSCVRQGFYGTFRGEALAIFDVADSSVLAHSLGYDSSTDRLVNCEILLDIANVLVGACLGYVGKLLGSEMGFSAPSLLGEGLLASQLLDPARLTADSALCLEVQLRIKERQFDCHLVALMPEAEICVLGEALDRFLASL
ncbi:MAG: hypothetical protein ACK4KV_05905 [Rhodocyclaceae bacterium]